MRAVLPPSIGRVAGNGGHRIAFSFEALRHLPRALAKIIRTELQERPRTFEGTHLLSHGVSLGTIAGRAYDAFEARNMLGMKFNGWDNIP